jgi:hypothetical protein
MLARFGETLTEIPPPVMAIVADAAFVLSATDVAVRVTVAGLGTEPGAV